MTNNKKQTAVDWYFEKIKSHFEHDGDLLETLTFTMAIAKQIEKKQIIDACNYGDFEELGEQYYNETFKGGSHE